MAVVPDPAFELVSFDVAAVAVAPDPAFELVSFDVAAVAVAPDPAFELVSSNVAKFDATTIAFVASWLNAKLKGVVRCSWHGGQ